MNDWSGNSDCLLIVLHKDFVLFLNLNRKVTIQYLGSRMLSVPHSPCSSPPPKESHIDFSVELHAHLPKFTSFLQNIPFLFLLYISSVNFILEIQLHTKSFKLTKLQSNTICKVTDDKITIRLQ